MSEVTIPIRDGIDDWGKILMTSLNSVFNGIVKVFRDDFGKLSAEVATVKAELLQNCSNDKAEETIAVSNETAQIVENV